MATFVFITGPYGYPCFSDPAFPWATPAVMPAMHPSMLVEASPALGPPLCIYRATDTCNGTLNAVTQPQLEQQMSLLPLNSSESLLSLPECAIGTPPLDAPTPLDEEARSPSSPATSCIDLVTPTSSTLREKRVPHGDGPPRRVPSFAECRQQRTTRPSVIPPSIPGDREPGPRQLIVNYLSLDINSRDLYELFAPYGAVEMARVATDPSTARSLGFGFVYMKRHCDAQASVAHASGRILLGKRIRVSYAIPQRPLLPQRHSSGAFYGPTAEPAAV